MTENPSPARLSLHITGLVQGVSFRWFAQRRAAELGLTGWVRNLEDSSVQVVAEGSHAALERLLDTLRQGPPEAVVENVDADWHSPSGEFHRFEIRS